jgi:hypothetical protein
MKVRELYRSANGDRWSLVRELSGRVFIRHEANAPSGGRVSDLDVGAFLSQGGHGPEKQELLRLIGTLTETAEPEPVDAHEVSPESAA